MRPAQIPVRAHAMLVLLASTLLSGAGAQPAGGGTGRGVPAGPLTFGVFTATFPADGTFTIPVTGGRR